MKEHHQIASRANASRKRVLRRRRLSLRVCSARPASSRSLYCWLLCRALSCSINADLRPRSTDGRGSLPAPGSSCSIASVMSSPLPCCVASVKNAGSSSASEENPARE